MDARVVHARPRDALAIRALHLGVLEEGRWFVRLPDELPDVDAIERDLVRFQQSDNSAWFVARLPEAPVAGMLVLAGGNLRRTRHVARLELMVDRRHRGRGLGAALLDHALAWAAGSQQLTKISLAVYADNERAIALYRSRGFAVEGRRVGEYREGDAFRDDLLLARPVHLPADG